jgi:hypothetical protein
MATEKAGNEAWAKGDVKWFEDNLSSKFVMYPMGQRIGKAAAIQMIGSSKCDVKSMNFTEPSLTTINDDAYVITYKSTLAGSCTMDGKTETLPAETRVASLVVREGGKWMGAWHGETPIIDPKNPPAPMSPAPAPEKKEAPPAGNTNSTNSNSNASSSTPAAVIAPSANTDALVKVHQAGWEAFKNRDAKFFNDTLASSFALVGPIGNYVGSKADTVRLWTETMKCEGVTNVKVSDGVSTAVSPTVEVLTLKGTADGTCDGQKNGSLYQIAIYVKEGEAWKLAYMLESPAA